MTLGNSTSIVQLGLNMYETYKHYKLLLCSYKHTLIGPIGMMFKINSQFIDTVQVPEKFVQLCLSVDVSVLGAIQRQWVSRRRRVWVDELGRRMIQVQFQLVRMFISRSNANCIKVIYKYKKQLHTTTF